jgi:hypothetical protein
MYFEVLMEYRLALVYVHKWKGLANQIKVWTIRMLHFVVYSKEIQYGGIEKVSRICTNLNEFDLYSHFNNKI